MNITASLSDDLSNSPPVRPFLLLRDRILPALEKRRPDLESMYQPVLGRPEIDPVLLMGVTLLQFMERLPDRQAAAAALFDLRWRLALGVPTDWGGFDPSSLVRFRARVAKHGCAQTALQAGLDAMRSSGYLPAHGFVRIDSTHVLAEVARISRLECVRETLRLTLEFLSAFGGKEAWEPWGTRYANRNPAELRKASRHQIDEAMRQAGTDARDLLARAKDLGEIVSQAGPVALLRRVYGEQFEEADAGAPRRRHATPAGAVINPHDPEAQWSTKKSLGKPGWVGYKAQVCESVPEKTRKKGEPTEAVITAVVTQPAITSDQASLSPVLEAHLAGGQAAPKTVFADAGYISAPALERAETAGYELCGPIGAPPYSAGRFGTDAFSVDLPGRKALCPAGHENAQCKRIEDTVAEITYYRFAWPEARCQACPLRKSCLTGKAPKQRRTIQVGVDHMRVQERRNLCKDTAYRERMKRRNAVEGTISELKRRHNARRSRYRGLRKNDLQTTIIAAACNLRRWAARLCWIDRQTALACP